MFLQGAIAGGGDIEEMFARYVSSISADAQKVHVRGLVVLRGNLILLKDMGIVTSGSKAKDTQSLGISYHSFSPIRCGLKALRILIADFTNSFLKRRKL